MSHLESGASLLLAGTFGSCVQKRRAAISRNLECRQPCELSSGRELLEFVSESPFVFVLLCGDLPDMSIVDVLLGLKTKRVRTLLVVLGPAAPHMVLQVIEYG